MLEITFKIKIQHKEWKPNDDWTFKLSKYELNKIGLIFDWLFRYKIWIMQTLKNTILTNLGQKMVM